MATMTTAAREKYNEYQRKWRREHPDKVKANRQRYQERHPERKSEYNARYWEKKAMAETSAESEGSTDE